MDYDKFKNIFKSIEHWGLKKSGEIMSYIQPTLNSIWGNDFEINEIIPDIYISDFSSACETEKLKNLGITHVITAITGVGEMYPDLFKYYTLDICDRSYHDIKIHFNPCSEFIDDAIKNNGKILVHCRKGISRSAAVIAAYLISKKNYTCDNAINLIKQKRDCASPNDGFVKQLVEYENEITKARNV